MKKLLFLFTLALAVTGVLVADPVINVDDDGHARATTSADLSISGNTGLVTLSSNVDGYNGATSPGSVNAESIINETIRTLGDPRLGRIVLSVTGDTQQLDGVATTSVTLPNSTDGYVLSPVICGGFSGCLNQDAYYKHYGSFGIELGTGFNLNAMAHAQLGYTPIMGGSGRSNMVLTFSLFEADGVTPVDVMTATPEPATWSLLGFSLGAVTLVRRRRQA